ncbi:MAG: hypothetical protein IKL52_07620, partial [Candidatus Gastranaerophilales bacterium]|nr:hypothetical protein [Candidatus Gastranaerophilales bacterium]
MKILSLNSSCQFFGAKLKTFDNQTSNHIKEAQENNKKYSRSSVISMQDSINANLEYKKQLNEAKKTVLTPKIEQFLSNGRFKFCDKDGNITTLCLEDKIKQSIKKISSIDADLYHATFTKENAQNIIENGFDEKLISRTKYGPGFYFTYSEGDA